MKLKNYTIYIGIILFLSCSPSYIMQSFEAESVAINTTPDSTLISIIAPYKEGIEEEMNEVLTYTKFDLKKGKPQSTIGNFVTDLCLNYAEANICLMNNGGLRTTISKGNITRGKIYQLMPFENELVVLELDLKSFEDLIDYITRRGEPFSGMKLVKKSNRYTVTEINNIKDYTELKEGEKIKVLTSDYLANGGDKMSFFKGKEQHKVGIKLRDAIIDYCIKTDTISVILDDRIKITTDE